MAELLRFQLDRVRLASVLQLVDAEGFTGVLRLPGGEILFANGEIVRASAGRVAGEEALWELFLAPAGQGVLEDREVEGVSLGGMLALIVDGCRRADDWERIGPMVLAPADGFELPADEPDRSLLTALDGQRAVFEAVAHAGITASAAVDRIAAALERGRLHEVGEARTEAFSASRAGAGAPVRSQPIDGSFADMLDLGRTHLRNRRLADAEAAFRAAVERRPDDRIAAQNLKRVLALRESEERLG